MSKIELENIIESPSENENNDLNEENSKSDAEFYDNENAEVYKSIYDVDYEETPEKTAEDEPKSIYELANPAESNQGVEIELSADTYTYSTTEKKLCFIGNDFEVLPTQLIYQFGLKAHILDVSFNLLTDLWELHQFPYLEELICDNNIVSENSKLPNLPNLKTFSCNKNKVRDIHVFIDKVKVCFPKITHLSLLGNEACPNELIDEEKDANDYTKYRKYVIYRLPTLKFLDCYEVTAKERASINDEPLFYDVVRNHDAIEEKLIVEEKSLYTPLSEVGNGENEFNNKALIGTCRYTYFGKQSEGNRFIKNDDL